MDNNFSLAQPSPLGTFKKLPPEIRCLIWENLAPSARESMMSPDVLRTSRCLQNEISAVFYRRALWISVSYSKTTWVAAGFSERHFSNKQNSLRGKLSSFEALVIKIAPLSPVDPGQYNLLWGEIADLVHFLREEPLPEVTIRLTGSWSQDPFTYQCSQFRGNFRSDTETMLMQFRLLSREVPKAIIVLSECLASLSYFQEFKKSTESRMMQNEPLRTSQILPVWPRARVPYGIYRDSDEDGVDELREIEADFDWRSCFLPGMSMAQKTYKYVGENIVAKVWEADAIFDYMLDYLPGISAARLRLERFIMGDEYEEVIPLALCELTKRNAFDLPAIRGRIILRFNERRIYDPYVRQAMETSCFDFIGSHGKTADAELWRKQYPSGIQPHLSKENCELMVQAIDSLPQAFWEDLSTRREEFTQTLDIYNN